MIAHKYIAELMWADQHRLTGTDKAAVISSRVSDTFREAVDGAKEFGIKGLGKSYGTARIFDCTDARFYILIRPAAGTA